MRETLRREYVFLRRPVGLGARVALVFAAVVITASGLLPIWQIKLVAPQYPEGLRLTIYSYKIVAGNNGQDLPEINNLNHYIGMKPIAEADFFEMRWVPFTLGVFLLLTLRAGVIGTMRSLVDLLALFLYFAAFSFGSFYYRLYSYGHHLDPRAPMHIQPFTPVILGHQQIANFVQSSLPQPAAVFFALFPLLVMVAMWMSRKEEPA